jgi:hypothetical protein
VIVEETEIEYFVRMARQEQLLGGQADDQLTRDIHYGLAERFADEAGLFARDHPEHIHVKNGLWKKI